MKGAFMDSMKTANYEDQMGCNFGVWTLEPLDHWGIILRQWCGLIDLHCHIMVPHDRPWWESEHACSGLIASAAHQCGYACSLETTLEKVGGSTDKGRCDLWIQFRPETKGDGSASEYVELKRDEIRVDERYKDLPNGYKRAVEDAQSITEKRGGKIGACLYMISGESKVSNIFAVLSRIHKKLKPKPHAMAWSFPECARDSAANKRFHPGAILVLYKLKNY
jgi:hypothetical protein